MYSKFLPSKTFSTLASKPRVTQLLIDGKFVNSISGKTFDTINPANEEKIISVQEADVKDVDVAVKAARRAFDEGPWRRMAPAQRSALIHRLADLMEKHSDELAMLESLDTGKTLTVAKHVDVTYSIHCLRYFAGWPDKIHGKTIPMNSPHFLYSKEEPVGVCGQVIPWNFPLVMMIWKIAPVLVTGCTTVVKPAEATPLTALRLGELIMEAGFPEGVVNVLPGYGATAGDALIKHHLVDKVAFTGSTRVGYHIMRESHKHNLKRITLELGGKSANIIMDDADIDLAIDQSQHGLFFNSG